MKTTGRSVGASGFPLVFLSVFLMLSQLFVKFAIEFPSIAELINPELPLGEAAWIMTAGWLILVPLCVQKHRLSFLAGGLWGVMHGCLGVIPPLIGACNHWAAGTIVSIQGVLIAIFCFLAYRQQGDANQEKGGTIHG